ncbi:MAG TPA: hypothetical protein VMJ92_04655 [Candidatus Limnocylindrales bacterium]|nr:hypothetical protein [Candidatus Limnocylindrales bacterium]
MKDARIRVMVLAVALALAVTLSVGASTAEAGLFKTIGSSVDLLNLTWE